MSSDRGGLPSTSANLFQELLEFIEDLSGIRTVIYDRERFTARAGRPDIDRSFAGHRSPFCRAIRRTDRGERQCVLSDVEEAVREARGRGAPFVHVCHAGLTEVVMPVMYRADHVATVFCGQVAVDGCLASDRAWLERRARALGAGPDQVVDAYAALPRSSEEKLIKTGRLLFLALSHLAEAEGRVGLERTFALYRHRPIREAIQYIDEHFREPIGVREAAGQCGLAPAYLSRLFHKVAGLTFSEFLTRRRIEHAKELLRTTSMDMTAVALDAGYSHQSYFGRKFRQLTGTTPHQYRAQNRAFPPPAKPRRRG